MARPGLATDSREGRTGSCWRGLAVSTATLVWTVCVVAVSPARAEHGAIDLQVIAPEAKAKATSDQEPPRGGNKKPPVLEVNATEPLVLQFFLKNLYPHDVIEDVTVRYYVVETNRLGRKPRPELKGNDGVVTRGQVTMDFKPKCRVGARLQFRVPESGLYLVRVETDTDGRRDHEHFSAIDLKASASE